MRQVSGKVSHAYIFVIKDTFDRLLDDEEINKICKPGLIFKAEEPEKYKMYTKTEEGLCYTVYSIHHPIGAKGLRKK